MFRFSRAAVLLCILVLVSASRGGEASSLSSLSSSSSPRGALRDRSLVDSDGNRRQSGWSGHWGRDEGDERAGQQRRDSTKVFNIGITRQYVQPTGYMMAGFALNGQVPGPLIRVREKELFQVTVSNRLSSEAASIHFHGLTMKDLPYYDGVAYGTQCPILPNQVFTYTVRGDRPGTFWYHSHVSAQHGYGLYGPLVVDAVDPSSDDGTALIEPALYGYTEERILMFSDWFHRPMHELLVGLENSTFNWIGLPQAILVNGKGVWNCSDPTTYPPPSVTLCSGSDTRGEPEVVGVEYGKTYRFRMINACSLLLLEIEIENHNLTIIEADGGKTQPYTVSDIDIDMGERYSVLFTADQPPGDYKITIKGDRPGAPDGHAIVRYLPSAHSQPAQPSAYHDRSQQLRRDGTFSNDTIFKVPFNYKKVVSPGTVAVPTATRQITVGIQQVRRLSGQVRWTLNGQASRHSPTPVLFIEALDLPYDATIPYIEQIEPGEVIQVVLYNRPNWNNATEDHPFHMHGHSFYVLGSGTEQLSDATLSLPPNTLAEVLQLNLINPPLRDQIDLPKNGWSVLRFVADNPGVWAFHCHLTWHMDMGMFMYFAYPTATLPRPPKSFPVCGQLSGSQDGVLMSKNDEDDSLSASDFMKGWAVGFVSSAVLIAVATVAYLKLRGMPIPFFSNLSGATPPKPLPRTFMSGDYVRQSDESYGIELGDREPDSQL